MSDYRPIACALHEQYQFAVLKKAWLHLRWRNELGHETEAECLPLDVYTRDGAEYLLLALHDKQQIEIRLDRIQHSAWAVDDRPL